MSKAKIIKLKKEGLTRNEIFQRILADNGLYGFFYGHTLKREEYSNITKTWNLILELVPK